MPIGPPAQVKRPHARELVLRHYYMGIAERPLAAGLDGPTGPRWLRRTVGA
jgi:hypothetical protein